MVDITFARPEDLDALLALVARAVKRMNALGNPQWGSDYPTREIYAADLTRRELYAARDGCGRLLGAACLNDAAAAEYSPLPWRSPGPALILHRMAVDPDCQRQGVGAALLSFAEDLARARGLPAIHTDTYVKNVGMQALLRGRGYEQVGEVRFGRPGRDLDYPCFEKLL